MPFKLIPKADSVPSRVVRAGTRVRVTFGRYGGGQRDVEIAYIMDPVGHELAELDLDLVPGVGYTLVPRGAPLSNGRYSIWPYPEAAKGPVAVRVEGKDLPLSRDVFDEVEIISERIVPSPLSGTVDRMLSALPAAALQIMMLRFAPGTQERARVDGEIARRVKGEQ